MEGLAEVREKGKRTEGVLALEKKKIIVGKSRERENKKKKKGEIKVDGENNI